MVSSMFEVYVTTNKLQFALKLLSQSPVLKDGDSYVLHRQMKEALFTMITGLSEIINVMYNYEIN